MIPFLLSSLEQSQTLPDHFSFALTYFSSFIASPLPWGFPHSSVGAESACSAGDLASIPGLWRSPGEGNGNPLQYSGLENPMDRGAWWATVHGVTRVGHDLATKPLNHHHLFLDPTPRVINRNDNDKQTSAAVHEVAKSWTRLGDWITTWYHFSAFPFLAL